MNIKKILSVGLFPVFVLSVFAFSIPQVFAVGSVSAVTPASMGDWTTYGTDSSSGTVTFVTDNGTSNGAAEFNTPDGNAVAGLDLNVAPTSIADIGAMSYTEKGVSGSAWASPAYVLGIATTGTGAADMYVWYEPV